MAESGFSDGVILNGGAAGVRDRTSAESFDGAGKDATTAPIAWFTAMPLHDIVRSLGVLRPPQDDTIPNGNLCLPLLELNDE